MTTLGGDCFALMDRYASRVFSKFFVLALSLGALEGCQKTTSPASPELNEASSASVLSPEKSLFEQTHAGAFQMNAALDALASASGKAEKLEGIAGGSAKIGFSELLGHLHEAGSTVQEASFEPPTVEKVAKNPDSFDERRLQAIEATNSALDELSQAQEIADGLSEGAPRDMSAQVSALQTDLDETVDALENAVHELGGKLDDDNPSKT